MLLFQRTLIDKIVWISRRSDCPFAPYDSALPRCRHRLEQVFAFALISIKVNFSQYVFPRLRPHAFNGARRTCALLLVTVGGNHELDALGFSAFGSSRH